MFVRTVVSIYLNLAISVLKTNGTISPNPIKCKLRENNEPVEHVMEIKYLTCFLGYKLW